MSTEAAAGSRTTRAWARWLGLGPVPVPPDVFSLETGGAAGGDAAWRLRHVRFARQDGGLRFADAETFRLDAAVFAPVALGGVLRDGEAVTALLRGRLDRLGGRHLEGASLLLPESWLRTVFCEYTELPRAAAARDEVLRFKLRRLVPYRVEELRLASSEVPPLAGQEEPRRLLLAFAAETVVAALENAFAAAGVRVGLVTNPSLALAAGLERGAPAPGLLPLIVADDREATVMVTLDGQPVVHRHRVWPEDLPAAARQELAIRDLRLVRSFLEDHLPGETLRQPLLLASDDSAAAWTSWIERAMGRGAATLGAQHLPLALSNLPPGWVEAAPLVGAASVEVEA